MICWASPTLNRGIVFVGKIVGCLMKTTQDGLEAGSPAGVYDLLNLIAQGFVDDYDLSGEPDAKPNLII